MFLELNGRRRVSGLLRGYDPFMNLVLDDAVEETTPNEKHEIGMVVCIGALLATPRPCANGSAPC